MPDNEVSEDISPERQRSTPAEKAAYDVTMAWMGELGWSFHIDVFLRVKNIEALEAKIVNALAAAQERGRREAAEVCAIIADEWAETEMDAAGETEDFCRGFWHAQEIIARAIRSRLTRKDSE